MASAQEWVGIGVMIFGGLWLLAVALCHRIQKLLCAALGVAVVVAGVLVYLFVDDPRVAAMNLVTG